MVNHEKNVKNYVQCRWITTFSLHINGIQNKVFVLRGWNSLMKRTGSMLCSHRFNYFKRNINNITG